MSDTTLTPPRAAATALRSVWRKHGVWLVTAALLILLAVFDRAQAAASVAFTIDALAGTAPFLVLSIGIAAWNPRGAPEPSLTEAVAGGAIGFVEGFVWESEGFVFGATLDRTPEGRRPPPPPPSPRLGRDD